jgi:prepilin-type N-terminal cleavage/methylation domain-containing protein
MNMTRKSIRLSNDGFTLIEIMLSMTLLSVVVVSLLGLTFTVARRSYSSTGVALTAATLNEHVSRMMALPYDSVNAKAGCTTVTTAPFQHTRCITVTLASNVKTVMVKVTPTDTKLRADSMSFQKSNPSSTNPFCQAC